MKLDTHEIYWKNGLVKYYKYPNNPSRSRHLTVEEHRALRETFSAPLEEAILLALKNQIRLTVSVPGGSLYLDFSPSYLAGLANYTEFLEKIL